RRPPGPALPQQVPALVERHLDLPQPLGGRLVGPVGGERALERVLLLHQRADPPDDVVVVHGHAPLSGLAGILPPPAPGPNRARPAGAGQQRAPSGGWPMMKGFSVVVVVGGGDVVVVVVSGGAVVSGVSGAGAPAGGGIWSIGVGTSWTVVKSAPAMTTTSPEPSSGLTSVGMAVSLVMSRSEGRRGGNGW